MTKKVWFMLGIVIFSILGGLAGCAPTPTAIEKYGLTFRYPAPQIGPGGESIEWFVQEIEERTNGRVEIEIFWGGALLKPGEGLDGISRGVADMGVIIVPYAHEKLLITNALRDGTGFLGLDMIGAVDVFWRLAEKYPQIEDEYLAQNQKVIAFNTGGNVHLLSAVPIRKIEDFNGLRVRAGSPLTKLISKTTGATPADIKASEAYSALETGVIDATHGDFDYMNSYKYYEVAKHFTYIDLGSAPPMTAFTINLDRWKELPSDIQQVMLEVGRRQHEVYGGMYYEQVEAIRERWREEEGVKFYELPPEDYEKMRTHPAVEELRRKGVEKLEAEGLPGQEMMDEFVKLLKQLASESRLERVVD